MNSKVTYLSSRSLAAYETMLIENFAQQLKRDAIIQRLRVGAICLGFGSLALAALAMPLMLQDFLRMF